MDEHRFDDVIRVLHNRGSRRGLLGVLAGGVFGLLAGAPAGVLAKAKKKKKKSKSSTKCPKKPCPRGFQRNKRTCKCECTRVPCSGGKEFDAEACRCACPRGLRECRDGCVGPDRCCPDDPPCPEDRKGCCHAPGLNVCTIDGCCRELDGMKACNNFCVDTNRDPNHCGGCNLRCGEGESCVGGRCGQGECPDGEPMCGVTCCGFGWECCDGVCERQGVAVCTSDGWCPSTVGHACCGTGDCSEDPCCRFSAGEACCVSSLDGETTCCPGGASQCAPGGCCPAETTWSSDLGCDACCPEGNINCDGCVAPVPGRG